ncbi:hypothetical protein AB0918_09815 [Streptomyces sp. NPDC006864]|uniref:hypothetical protein n=1 Tax=Streptomyces sp. NPDC006864 TaxID=3154780 RepID=UPI0034550C3F
MRRSHSHPAAIDRNKSPLLDADHDAVRIADALRRSPHITFVAPAAPGDESVWFRDTDRDHRMSASTATRRVP